MHEKDLIGNERSNENCSEEISIIAHEIKGAFNTILGISAHILMEDKNLSIETKELVRLINTTAFKSYEYFENLISFSKLNYFSFKRTRMNFDDIVNNALSYLKFQIDNKKINVELKYDKLLKISYDHNLIVFIIRNLLQNAIKFSNPNGKITIDASEDDDGLELVIADNGIGMTSDEVNMIFKNDKVVSKSGTMYEKGSGIGLKLCLKLLQKVNGDLIIGSTLNKGTTITVIIPNQ